MEAARPDLFPFLMYADARTAIAFFERAFGFSKSLVVENDGGRIVHAEVGVGRGTIMLAEAGADEWRYTQPNRSGLVSTGSSYVAVDDTDALFARATAAGAEVMEPPTDTDYGSRDCSVRDPEGFLWHFGTFHPAADESAPQPTPELYTGMRYADARGAIAWLTRAFGLREQFVVPGEGNEIAHAQLALATSILMLGSARDDRFLLKQPAALDGAYTQSICAYVADPDAHCAVAKAAGAIILKPPADGPPGHRTYVARDPEGYIWSFGTYRPEAAA